MSVWSDRRKQRQQQSAPPDPKEELTRRVAWRICSVMYGEGGCGCKQRDRDQVCDHMQMVAQQVLQEIIGQ